MRKLLLNPTPLFRKLRQLSMLLTLLLVPLGALGQTIAIDDSTPNQSGEITGTSITKGTVTFNSQTNTLTLNDATITGLIHWMADADLTIELIGANSITRDGFCIDYEGSGSGTATPQISLSFTAGGTAGSECSLELRSTGTAPIVSVINGFSNDNAPSMGPGLFWIPTWTNDVVTSATIKTLLGGGAGTSESPLIITSYDHLKDFATYVNNGTLTTEHIKLGADIDCTGKTGFEPIGTGDLPFIGKFDGNNCTIENLTYSTTGTEDYVGLFGIVGDDAVSDAKIEKLTLSNCSFNGGGLVGGIVGELKNGTIENCELSSCTVKGGDAFNLYAGGIAGKVDNGTISTCKFSSGFVDGSTAYSGEPSTAYAGGIVGCINTTNSVTVSSCTVSTTNVNSVTSGTSGTYNIYVGGIVGRCLGTVEISGNKVTNIDNTKKISCQSSDIFNGYYCGAIIGEKGDATLTNNTYEYDVTTDIAGTTKSGYTHRGTDAATDPDGVSLYTKIVSLPTANSAGTVEGVDGTYYKFYGTSLYVAPGQTAKIDATPNTDNNYALAWLQAVKTGTTDVVICDSTNIENGGRRYTFTMPDAEVTVNVSWDELYNLWIGDTQVTSANAAHILGENNTTVTFTAADPKASSDNTLTLNGATLEVPVKVGLASLTFDIQGTNSITTNTTCIQIDNTTSTIPTLTFKSTSDEVGNLTLKNTDNSNTGVISSGFSGNFTIKNELTLLTSGNYTFSDGEVHEAQLVPFYGVQVGKTFVHADNATDVLGDGKISFNKNTSTLTLNNANAGGISTSLTELTIELVGNNTLTETTGQPVLCSLNDSKVTIKIQSTAEPKGMLTMKTSNPQFYDRNVTLSIISPLGVISGELYGNNQNDNTVIIGEAYNLSVAGTAVTILNKDNVLGDGKISFTPSSNTLTLNGATINGNINYNGTTDFTIALNGSNSIENKNGNYAIVTNTTTTNSLKFEKATNASTAELTLKWASGDKAISANDSILGNGLYWKPIAATQMNITDNPEFVIVGDYAIPDGTTVNGTTSGTITYNATDKLLTISSFSETYDKDAIKTGVSGLKVKLVGESVVTCNGYDKRVFIAFATSASIQFVKNDASSKLTMSTSLDPLYGFAAEAITYDGLFYYNAGNNQYIIRPKSSPTIKFVKRDQSNGNIPDDPKDYVYVSGTGAIQMPYVASYYAPKPVFSDDYQLSDTTRYEYTMSVDGMVRFALGGTTQGNPGKIDYADNGEISLLKAGTVTITCSFPGNMQNNPCSASYTLQVNKADANLAYNATTSNAYIDLSGNGQWGDPNGTGGTAPTLTKPTNVTGITYTSSNTNVATVSTAGVVTPKGAGSATITATIKDDERYNDATASYTLTVMVPATISFANATASIVNTETYTQTASTVPAGSTITYSSSNNDVNVNANGEVTINNSFYGKATITATVTAVPDADPQYYYVLPDNTAFQATYDLTVSKVFNSVKFEDGQNFATYYNQSENMTVPEGLTAYLITGTSGNSVVTYPINYLPKNVPLLLEKSGTAGSTLTNTIYSGTELTDAERGSNNLQYAEGNLGISDILGGTPYILYKNEFVKASGTIRQNHCYLLITNPAPTRGYYSIGNGNDGSTAIDDTLIDNEETTNDDWYDLQGRRIQKPTKAGIYIVNGKKMIVK